MFSEFFINRPRFAFVISILLLLGGIIALFTLPVTLYPDIAPSQIEVTANYPGADAQTVMDTVIQPIESQLNRRRRRLRHHQSLFRYRLRRRQKYRQHPEPGQLG